MNERHIAGSRVSNAERNETHFGLGRTDSIQDARSWCKEKPSGSDSALWTAAYNGKFSEQLTKGNGRFSKPKIGKELLPNIELYGPNGEKLRDVHPAAPGGDLARETFERALWSKQHPEPASPKPSLAPDIYSTFMTILKDPRYKAWLSQVPAPNIERYTDPPYLDPALRQLLSTKPESKLELERHTDPPYRPPLIPPEPVIPARLLD